MSGALRPAGSLYPAVPLVACGYLAGTAGGAVLGGPWWYTVALAALVAAAFAVYERPLAVGAAALVFAVGAAGLGHARFADAEAHPLPSLPPSGVHELAGVLLQDALVDGSVARADMRLETVDGAAAEGRVRLFLRAPLEPLRAGERLRLQAEVSPPPEIEDFDYGAYLRSRGVIGVVSFPDTWDREGTAGEGIAGSLRELRRWLTTNIERSLPEPPASLAAGVLLGERRNMHADVEEDLRATGTTHLVVVSGQNIALLLGSAIAVLTLVVSRRRAALLSLALLAPYVVLIGADPPVVRAALMSVGIVLAAALGRRTPGWVYLVYAAAAMLAVDPMLARDVAFQLSATATAGVILIAPVLRDWVLARLPASGPATASLVEVGAVATGAALAVTPVQAAAFERVSLITIPANIAVAPFYEATVLVALVAAFLGWAEPVASAAGLALALVPRAFLVLVEAMAGLPGAVVDLEAPLLAGLGWYAALVLGTRRVATLDAVPAVLDPAHRSGLGRTVALAAVAGGLWLVVLQPADGFASVTVLDVGQGLAVLVEDEGNAVLIDTGPPDNAVMLALGRVAPGEVPATVIVTHADNDHAGGLAALRRRGGAGRVLAARATLEALALGDAAAPLDIGDRIRLSDRTTIEVLAPPVATAGRAHGTENDASLVLLVSVGDRRVLLPADVEAPAEEWLVRSGYRLDADVLVVPHHGSASSSTPEFVSAVGPAVAVVSVGAGNPYGHPVPDVLDRYEGAEVLRTDLHGDVVLRSDGLRLWWSTARRDLPEAAAATGTPP